MQPSGRSEITGSFSPALWWRKVRLLWGKQAAGTRKWVTESLFSAQVAKGEITVGQAGSGRLRAEALRCLRLLVQTVGDGDALAFFVPGLVSGLGAALHAAGWLRASSAYSSYIGLAAVGIQHSCANSL